METSKNALGSTEEDSSEISDSTEKDSRKQEEYGSTDESCSYEVDSEDISSSEESSSYSLTDYSEDENIPIERRVVTGYPTKDVQIEAEGKKQTNKVQFNKRTIKNYTPSIEHLEKQSSIDDRLSSRYSNATDPSITWDTMTNHTDEEDRSSSTVDTYHTTYTHVDNSKDIGKKKQSKKGKKSKKKIKGKKGKKDAIEPSKAVKIKQQPFTLPSLPGYYPPYNMLMYPPPFGLQFGPPHFHVIEEEETPRETYINVNTQLHQPPPPPKLKLEEILEDLEQFSKADKKSPAGKLYKSLKNYIRFLNGEKLSSEENAIEAMLLMDNMKKRKMVKKKLKKQQKRRMMADLGKVQMALENQCVCRPMDRHQSKFFDGLMMEGYQGNGTNCDRGGTGTKVKHLPDLSRVLGQQCALRTTDNVEYERAYLKPGEKAPILKYKIADKASTEEILQLPEDIKRDKEHKKGGLRTTGAATAARTGVDGEKAKDLYIRETEKLIGEIIDNALKEKLLPNGEEDIEHLRDIVLDEEEALGLAIEEYQKYVDKQDTLMTRYRDETLKNDLSNKYMMDLVMETEFNKLLKKENKDEKKEEKVIEEKVRKPLVIAVKRNYPKKENKSLIRKPIARARSSVDVNIDKSGTSVRLNTSKEKINNSDESLDVKFGGGIHEYKQEYMDKVYFEEFKDKDNKKKHQRISVKLHSRDSQRKYYYLDSDSNSGSEHNVNVKISKPYFRRHEDCIIL